MKSLGMLLRMLMSWKFVAVVVVIVLVVMFLMMGCGRRVAEPPAVRQRFEIVEQGTLSRDRYENHYRVLRDRRSGAEYLLIDSRTLIRLDP